MSLSIAWPLVLFLILLVLYFAAPKSRDVIVGIFYCSGAVWFMSQLFLAFHR